MTEDLLHFIWKLRLLKPVSLYTTHGFPLKIVQPGVHNSHAGPDFSNGRIVLNGTEWVGNIELHKRSSEWEMHGHHRNPAYDNVILHVVYEYDKDVFNSKNELVPTFELRHYIEEGVPEKYSEFYTNRNEIPCGAQFSECDAHVRETWMERVLVERLETKTKLVNELFEYTKGDWEETFYLLLCHSLGFKVNAHPFLQLARITPLRLLLKYAGKQLQLEALLFGQAGFLEGDFIEEYSRRLKLEYAFLKHKYSLQPLPSHIWKMMRMRPANFPTVRIAQLAAFISANRQCFSALIETTSIRQVINIFKTAPHDWWHTHYSLKLNSPPIAKKTGEGSIENILINSVLPLLFFYGRMRNREDLSTKAIDWYSELAAENNHITRLFHEIGYRPSNAAQSQALLQLHNHYCSLKKCLSCGIGAQILNRKTAAI